MKRVLFILTVVSLIACSKPENSQTNRPLSVKKSLEIIKSSVRQGDVQSTIEAYSLLSAEEKYDLWYDHLSKAKSKYDSLANDSKSTLIDSLMKHLSISVFEDSSYDRDVFLNYYLPTWQEEATSLFSIGELYNITFNPDCDDVTQSPEPEYVLPSNINCWCHAGQSGFSCTKYGFPEIIQTGVCERQGDCNESSHGCGWLWLMSCNGNHCQF